MANEPDKNCTSILPFSNNWSTLFSAPQHRSAQEQYNNLEKIDRILLARIAYKCQCNIIYKKQKCSQSLLGFMKDLSPLLVLSVTTHAEYNAHSFHSFCANADISVHSIFIHPSQCTNPAHIIGDRNTARNKTLTTESYPTELTAQFTCILHDQRTKIGFNKVWSSKSV